MAQGTGENEQGLRVIADLTRLGSMIILIIHFYVWCYGTFVEWGLTGNIINNFIKNLAGQSWIKSPMTTKTIAIVFLSLSLIGNRGKRSQRVTAKKAITYSVTGLVLYYSTTMIIDYHIVYITLTISGILLFISGAAYLTRIIKTPVNDDIFNERNQAFPQEERKLQNDFSINLPAQYYFKGKIRKSWINIINPFRGTLIMGSPGAGKSYFIIRHIISQHLQKGFAMFVYDFKYDDLTKIAYNEFLKHKASFKAEPKFYVINFDRLTHTNRCNPLDPKTMADITDAHESATTILLGMNREWVKKEGDFFVNSAINFVTAIIWFLRKFEDGKYCTLPHVIELMMLDYDELFSILRLEPTIHSLINPFITAYQNEAMEQLEGQVGSAKIAMGKLSSPQLYYVLSGNDFSLDINDPLAPKVVCLGNNPQKQKIYGVVGSLFITRMTRTVNQKDKLQASLIFDEFPTIYFGGMGTLLATARSNRVAITFGVQDFSQLKKDYGRDEAEVLINIAGNVIAGQVTGDTAKQLSERFGKIMQQRQSQTINHTDTSVSNSFQLESAVPPSVIANLSSGQFIGIVGDEPKQKIKYKMFHCEIINDHEKIQRDQHAYRPLPPVRNITETHINDHYGAIKKDIEQLTADAMKRISLDPTLQHLLVYKKS
jgi:hypothetical protein